MAGSVEHRNAVILELGEQLAELRAGSGVRPGPRVPRSRRYKHLSTEQPIDEGMFIHGGFVCGPRG